MPNQINLAPLLAQELQQGLAGIAPGDLTGGVLPPPASLGEQLLQSLKSGRLPGAAKVSSRQGQPQGAGIQLQPPPLQVKASDRAGFEQQPQVGARAHTHLHHLQSSAGRQPLQLGGGQKRFPGLPQGAAATVETLAISLAPKAEAAIVALAFSKPLRRLLRRGGGPGHPRRRGKTRRRRRCRAGGCRPPPPGRPPPGSWPPGGRFRCPPRPHGEQ